jgi:hypothetical protein
LRALLAQRTITDNAAFSWLGGRVHIYSVTFWAAPTSLASNCSWQLTARLL